MTLSVVIPACRAATYLPRCLAALQASTHHPDEVIVVIDGPDDGSTAIATAAGARVVRLRDEPQGPAVARNAGTAAATGELVLFVDADVLVHQDVVSLVADHFAAHPGDAALFGSYDAAPADPRFVSRFKNLMHHFVHQQGGRVASTFWAGCGAIRRDVFLSIGGFDERYERPSIEDIEFGVRLRAAGHAVALRPDIQGTHLKRWTLTGLLRSDIFDRAVPWTRLILQQGRVPRDLNLAGRQRASALAAWVFVAALAFAPFVSVAIWPAAAAAFVLGLLNWRLGVFMYRAGGLVFAVRAALMFVLYLLYSSAVFGAVALVDRLPRWGRGHVPRAIPIALLVLAGGLLAGRAQDVPARGSVDTIQIDSDALRGNLIGDSPIRDVSVYLPAGYADDDARRYPVVYFLHGFTDSEANWFGRSGDHWIHLPSVLDRAFAESGAVPMIVVMPNAFTTFEGSYYTASITNGDWETFVADELVAEIDRRYRTLASRSGRGLAGHSMGGYGAVRFGMKRPDVFSSIYAMSACCLDLFDSLEASTAAEAITTIEQIAGADFLIKASLAHSAAFSPNPDKPPFYLDLPTRDGEWQPDVVAEHAANAPVAMVPQYVFQLRQLTAFAFDVGTNDRLLAGNEALDRALTTYEVPHTFETYDGDHLNRIAERIQTRVLPFFAEHLTGE